jgi:hypothetical protein
MLKLNAVMLYAIQIIFHLVAVASAVGIAWVYVITGDIVALGLLSLFWVGILAGLIACGVYTFPRNCAVRAWRAASIAVGDTSVLGSYWRYDDRARKYVPYKYMTVTVKNPAGVTRTDGKHFDFDVQGMVPLGEAVQALGFPDRSHVLVEYRTQRDYTHDDELPAGTCFIMTRLGFITSTEDHLTTQARLQEEEAAKAAAQRDQEKRSAAEKVVIARLIG